MLKTDLSPLETRDSSKILTKASVRPRLVEDTDRSVSAPTPPSSKKHPTLAP